MSSEIFENNEMNVVNVVTSEDSLNEKEVND